MGQNLDLELFGSGSGSTILPCGYVDASGKIHNQVFLKEVNGYSELEMEFSETIITERVTQVLCNSITKIGNITDKKLIYEIVSDNLKEGSPFISLDRLVAMKYIRQISVGNLLKSEKKCPLCRFLVRGSRLDLRDLELKTILNPTKRKYEITLPKTKFKLVLKILSCKAEEECLFLNQENSAKSLAILARVESLNGAVLEKNKNSLKTIQDLPLSDRNYISEMYKLAEGWLDTDVILTCVNKKCGIDFEFPLDLGQSFLVIPGKELKYSKMFKSLGPRFYAFDPLGNKTRTENEITCLAEAYQWNPSEVKELTASERHRYIKRRELIIDVQNNRTTTSINAEGSSQTAKTGIGPQSLR